MSRRVLWIDRNMRRINARVREKRFQKKTVEPDRTRMQSREPRPRERNALVEPFAARMDAARGRCKRFAAAHEMRRRVDIVDVERTEIDDSGHVKKLAKPLRRRQTRRRGCRRAAVLGRFAQHLSTA